MTWVAPLYKREAINIAARTKLDALASVQAQAEAVGIINNWRSAHAFPLNCFRMTLRNRAKTVYDRALIAQRLKRLIAIEAKLRRFKGMRLSQMQDIGGCRAVLPNVRLVEQLADLYKRTRAKNPKGRHELVHEDNYIASPKEDGYRGIHLIYRYRSTAPKHQVFNDLKVEIQLRSRPQHAWATAVETVDAFTGQTLKSDQGQKDWARFFSLMSCTIARRERRPTIPNTPINPTEMVRELRDLTRKLKVQRLLNAWRYSVKWLLGPRRTPGTVYYLLFVDPEVNTVNITNFKAGDLLKAQDAYAEAEKRVETQTGAQAVLVSVEELSSLRRAYPNYFVDTRAFLREVARAIR